MDAKEVLKILKQNGFKKVSQKGSHLKLSNGEAGDGDTPQLINVKAEKNVRINVMIDTGLLKIANDRAKKEYNGNRSAYIQDLISRDASLSL